VALEKKRNSVNGWCDISFWSYCGSYTDHAITVLYWCLLGIREPGGK